MHFKITGRDEASNQPVPPFIVEGDDERDARNRVLEQGVVIDSLESTAADAGQPQGEESGRRRRLGRRRPLLKVVSGMLLLALLVVGAIAVWQFWNPGLIVTLVLILLVPYLVLRWFLWVMFTRGW